MLKEEINLKTVRTEVDKNLINQKILMIKVSQRNEQRFIAYQLTDEKRGEV